MGVPLGGQAPTEPVPSAPLSAEGRAERVLSKGDDGTVLPALRGMGNRFLFDLGGQSDEVLFAEWVALTAELAGYLSAVLLFTQGCQLLFPHRDQDAFDALTTAAAGKPQ